MISKEWIILSILIILIVILNLVRPEYLVIVTSHYKENLDWLSASPWRVVVCNKKGADAISFTSDESCSLDINKGREASSYLKYIVSNYHSLPKYIAFLHGHEEAGHQHHPYGILKAIDEAKKEDFSFISLNNQIDLKKESGEAPVLPRHHQSQEFGDHPVVWKEMRKHWSSIFEPIFNEPLPNYFRFDCGAQFIVSSEAVHRHPKEVYEKLLNWLTEPECDDWARSVAMEFMWHSLFTGAPFDICNDPSDPHLYSQCSDEIYRKSRFN